MLTGLLNRLHNRHETEPHDPEKAKRAIEAWIKNKVKRAKLELKVAILRQRLAQAATQLEKTKRAEFKRAKEVVLANGCDDFHIASAGDWRPSETLQGIRIIPVLKHNRVLLENHYLKPATARLRAILDGTGDGT